MDIDQGNGNPSSQASRTLAIVRRILKAWTGYQLGIKNQSGGWQTKQKDEWYATFLSSPARLLLECIALGQNDFRFGDVLSEYLLENRDADPTDLAEWMESILNDEFDLILEDNSLEPTADALLKCAKWIRTGNTEKLDEFTAKLPTEEQVQAVASQSRTADENDDDSSSDGSDDEESESMDTEVRGLVYQQRTYFPISRKLKKAKSVNRRR